MPREIFTHHPALTANHLRRIGIPAALTALLYVGVGATAANLPGVPRQDITIQLPFMSGPEETNPAACIAKLPLKTRVGQLVMPGVRAEHVGAYTEVARANRLGGIVILTEPGNPEALRALKAAGSAPIRPMVAIDYEGGSVQRYTSFGNLPSAAATTQAKPKNTSNEQHAAAVEQRITEHGQQLNAVGINVVFGPVVDVANANPRKNPLGDRAFSADPNVVVDFAAATARGWNASGNLPVLKHFPGHGSANGDSRVALPKTPPLSELTQRDLIPYQAEALRQQRVGVMMGHLEVPGLTAPGEPASLSSGALAFLRDTLGYRANVVFSDSLDMSAITGRGLTPGQAAVATINAGTDVAVTVELSTNTTPVDKVASITGSLQQAVQDGSLPEARVNESVGRLLELKRINPCKVPRS